MTESSCNWARRHMLEAVRAGLSGDVEQRLREHMQQCEECRKLEQAERILDETLARLPVHRAPESLKARLVHGRSVDAAFRGATTKQKSVYRIWISGALAAMIALVAFGFWQNHNESQGLLAEAVNDHLRVLYAEHPLEIESGGIHQVKPWFEGRLDFAPTLGFEGNGDFALVGGSVAYFVDRKAAAFSFKHRLHVISLFVFRAEGLPWPQVAPTNLGRLKAASGRSRGFGTLVFRDGDLGYALVSDVDRATLERLGTEIVNSLPRP